VNKLGEGLVRASFRMVWKELKQKRRGEGQEVLKVLKVLKASLCVFDLGLGSKGGWVS